MNHILRAMEWLLGAIEHRAYQLRLKLYYHRTGGVPPKVRRIGNEVLQATRDATPARFPNSEWPAGRGYCAPNSGARSQEAEHIDAATTYAAASLEAARLAREAAEDTTRNARVDAAIAYANQMGDIAAASLAVSARIVQAGDTP